jgi:hypothetical protein
VVLLVRRVVYFNFIIQNIMIEKFDAGSQKAQQKKYGDFQEFWTAVYRPYARYQR